MPQRSTIAINLERDIVLTGGGRGLNAPHPNVVGDARLDPRMQPGKLTRRALLASAGASVSQARPASAPRPNILWITLEDTSADFGCYGNAYATTPRIDRLAAEGLRFTHVWSNAGMCSPARATLITGMYANTTGAQHQRSLVSLPEYIRPYPEYLRRAGYYASNHAKTDYNWQAPAGTWDSNDADWVAHGWKKRADGQPFFTVINLMATHSSQLY